MWIGSDSPRLSTYLVALVNQVHRKHAIAPPVMLLRPGADHPEAIPAEHARLWGAETGITTPSQWQRLVHYLSQVHPVLLSEPELRGRLAVVDEAVTQADTRGYVDAETQQRWWFALEGCFFRDRVLEARAVTRSQPDSVEPATTPTLVASPTETRQSPDQSNSHMMRGDATSRMQTPVLGAAHAHPCPSAAARCLSRSRGSGGGDSSRCSNIDPATTPVSSMPQWQGTLDSWRAHMRESHQLWVASPSSHSYNGPVCERTGDPDPTYDIPTSLYNPHTLPQHAQLYGEDMEAIYGTL